MLLGQSKRVIGSLPKRPFPFKNGGIVSNWTWTTPAFTKVSIFGVPVWMNLSRADIRSSTRSAGGTYAALPGRVPPIQFWERRNYPGCMWPPRRMLDINPVARVVSTSRPPEARSGVERHPRACTGSTGSGSQNNRATCRRTLQCPVRPE